MSFNYTPANPGTPITPPGLSLRCKSFLIDVTKGSGALTATTYDLGWLPKGSQIVGAQLVGTVGFTGGTVSAATMAVAAGGHNLMSNINVFGPVIGVINAATYFTNLESTFADNLRLTYTLTLTGAGATAGKVYISVFYVE